MLRMTPGEFEAFRITHPHAVPNSRQKVIPAQPIPQFHIDVSKLNLEADSDGDSPKKKYFNRKMYVYENGVSAKKETSLGELLTVYDSIAEYQREQELLALEKMKVISGLKRQVRILIQKGFEYQRTKVRPIYYVADFQYVNADGKTVVEDVKAFDKKRNKYRTTADFNLKWKLLKMRYPEVLFELHGKNS